MNLWILITLVLILWRLNTLVLSQISISIDLSSEKLHNTSFQNGFDFPTSSSIYGIIRAIPNDWKQTIIDENIKLDRICNEIVEEEKTEANLVNNRCSLVSLHKVHTSVSLRSHLYRNELKCTIMSNSLS
jgi:hypothetical protein